MGRYSEMTEKKMSVYLYMRKYGEENYAWMPTLRQIVLETDYSSTSEVSAILDFLVMVNLLGKFKRNNRTYYYIKGLKITYPELAG